MNRFSDHSRIRPKRAQWTFDTHEAIKRLTRSGLDERQAEAVTETIKAAQDAHLEQLATKEDIKDVIIRIHQAVITLGAFVIAVGGVILAYLELQGG